MTQPHLLDIEAETERLRLQALADSGLAGTGPEPEFDNLVVLAREICGTPFGFITLLDENEQTMKSAVGMDRMSMPRSEAFCNYTIRQYDGFTVSDTLADKRFESHPLVVGDPRFRFYSGVALRTESGHALGALCVMDTKPRALTHLQQTALRVLAQQAEAQIHLRTRVVEQVRMAKELQTQREILQMFLDCLPVEAYAKTDDGTILFYNRQVAERFQIGATEWLGKRSHDIWEKESADQIAMEEEYVLRSGRTQETYVEMPAPDGEPGYWKMIRSPLQLGNGKMLLATIAMDLSAELRREAELQKAQDSLEEANRKLRSLAMTDELTTLWNRRAFNAQLETEVFRAQQKQIPMALLMLDVDNFKQLNDSYGHPHGDEVLQQVADGLRRAVREQDFVARYGGEEFAIILPGTDMEGGRVLCSRISDVLKHTRWLHRHVTVSIGIAECCADITADDLLNMADAAMYRAKRSGKNCAVQYTPEMSHAAA